MPTINASITSGVDCRSQLQCATVELFRICRRTYGQRIGVLEAGKMGESRRRSYEVVLWLALAAACSSDKEPSGPDIDANFDNPVSIAGGKNGGGAARGGTGPGTGTIGLDGACANGRITASRVAPKVALVLDGSCS